MVAIRSELPESDTRLAELLSRYVAAKAAYEQEKANFDGLKTELKNAMTAGHEADDQAYGVTVINASYSGVHVRLQAKASWRLDTARIKTERPDIYSYYGKESVAWELRQVK